MQPERQVLAETLTLTRKEQVSYQGFFREFSMHTPIRMSSNARVAVACLYTCPSTSP